MMLKTDFKPEYVNEINEYIKNELNMVSRMTQKPFDELYRVGTPSMNNVFMKFDLTRAEDAQFAQYLIDIGFKYNDMISTGTDNKEVFQYNGVYWESLPIHTTEFHKGRMIFLQQWVEKKLHRIINIIADSIGCSNTLIPSNYKSDIKDLEKQIKSEKGMKNPNESKILELNVELEHLKKYKHFSDIVKPYQRSMDELTRLSCNTKRNAIVDIYLSILYQPDINWDANPELFAFNNRIMNLSTREFIQPRKDQYIKTTCGWDWNNDYAPSHMVTLSNVITSILPIQSIHDYYLMYISTGLSGNKIQKVLINTGKGGNGKSIMSGLFEKTIGNYGHKISADVLCHPMKGDSANPEIANMDGKRSVFFSEPNANQRICSSTLKTLSGDISISARGLYSSKTNITIPSTFFGDCNKIPLFDQIDADSEDSLLRRLVICPFITKAVTKEEYDASPDKTYLNIKQPFAEDVSWLDEHKQAYFCILLEHYHRFKNIPNAIDMMPEECKNKAISHLLMSCDIMNWLNEYVEKDTNYENSIAIPLKQLYERFKNHDVFSTFSKKDQRKYTMKYFIHELENQKSLEKYIKCRDKYHSKQKLKTTCLVGYKYINDTDSDIEEFNM
jgi:hypothetical protein